MRKAARRILSGFAFVLAGAGCSVIVGNDVPDFGCTIDAPGVCPSGLHCDVSANKCVATDGATPGDEPADDDAGDSTISHPETSADSDAPSGPLDLGLPCRLDDDCKSKLCASSTVLTTAIAPASTGPICTMPCCSSADCPSSLVCFNGGTGGSYCVPARVAGRSTPSTGSGKSAGATCVASTECRSGLCSAPKGDTGVSVCIDTCCVDSECTGDSVCRIGGVDVPAPLHTVWVCAPPEPGAVEPAGYTGSDCSLFCSTNACSGGTNCRPSCSNTASCQAITGFSTGVCIQAPIGTEYVRYCLKAPLTGGLPIGQTCVTNTDCANDYCDNELKKCLNVCGMDSDCAANEACRPSAVGTPFLRCVTAP